MRDSPEVYDKQRRDSKDCLNVTFDPPEPMTELLTCPVELPPLHRVQIYEETVNATLLLRTGLLIQLVRANSHPWQEVPPSSFQITLPQHPAPVIWLLAQDRLVREL